MPAAADGSSFLNILSIIELHIYGQDSVLPGPGETESGPLESDESLNQ
jgi:hypothetical protein